jgi:hypothetical protein
MKFGKNWIDDDSISEEEIMAYVETLEPVKVLNYFEKLELDMAQANLAKAELEEQIKSKKTR